ncbi:MAG: chaperonin GroES [Candidatus Omnitrophota bacterium]
MLRNILGEIKMKVKERTRTQVKLKPLGNRILVEPVDIEERTTTGIYIPDTAQEKQQRGKVVNVGVGKTADDGKRIPVEVQIGDEILYGKYSGSEIKIGGVEYLIITEDDVLGIIKN